MASEDLFASPSIDFVENNTINPEETEGIKIDNEISLNDEEIEQQNEDGIDELATGNRNEPSTSTAANTNSNNPINKDTSVVKTVQEPKLIQLPLSRIRGLMKLDPDLQIASNEAVFAIAKATEMFIESLAREAYTFTAQAKKKTIQKRDVDLTFTTVDSLMFLEGAMNFD